MIKIIKYNSKKKKEWNDFLCESKNGIFLFDRNYMDYHNDRFNDHSLMIYHKDQLVSVFPANIDGNIIASHAGLTFGGFVTNSKMKTELMLNIFQSLIKYLDAQSVKKLIYKPIPHIYHKTPAEEDLYSLFRIGATLVGSGVSSSALQAEAVGFSKIRQRQIKKAEKSGLTVKLSDNYKLFWDILSKNLKKQYNKAPVHSTDEIRSLQSSFPENIKLFCAYKNAEIQAGVCVYESDTVAHAQYIASSEEGKKLGALDIVFSNLIENTYRNKRYFDFGISTENSGSYLNSGLIQHKESFGARAIVYNCYEISI